MRACGERGVDFKAMETKCTVINDSITALLLDGQYSIVRSRALLLLASAYLFNPDANALFLGSGRGCPSERCGRNFRP